MTEQKARPTIDLSIISSSIEPKLGDFSTRLISGVVRPSDVLSYDMYQSIYKIRHDAIHAIICYDRGIEFGEKAVELNADLGPDVRNHVYWNKVKTQSPDIFVVKGSAVNIVELTISKSDVAKKNKISKYSLLCKVLRESGFQIHMEIIVVAPLISSVDEIELRRMHNFSESAIQQTKNIIDNINKLLHEIHSSNQGQTWLKLFHKIEDNSIKVSLSDSYVEQYYHKFENKPFNSFDDFKSIMNYDEPENITMNDQTFLEHVANLALDMKSSLSSHVQPSTKTLRDKLNKQKNTERVPSIFPLPYFLAHKTTHTMKRSTWSDVELIERLKGLMSRSGDPVLMKLSETKTEGPFFTMRLNDELKYDIALQGPGRKKYLRKSAEHKKVDDSGHNNNIGLLDDTIFKDLEELSMELSERTIEAGDGHWINRIESILLEYIKSCQIIYQEICINANRRLRRREWTLKPTGVQGIYILLYPGPKLRTGEAVSTVWFKILLDPEDTRGIASNKFFKKLYRTLTLYQSDWISVDANRLDHYIRCYDRIVMAYCSVLESEYDSIEEGVMKDKSNTLAMIAMTYMEDKRMTSKLLQDVRFIIMSTLSVFTDWSEHLKKLDIPVRSSLQSYYLSRMIRYIENYKENQTLALQTRQYGQAHIDPVTSKIDDMNSGAVFKMNRILTLGDPIGFPTMLCEMYYTMLFNKNQDDPTHSSFQILNKMLKGEESLSRIKMTTNLHTGLRNDDISDATEMIMNPHTHQFSRRAHLIGSKLQATHHQNQMPSGLSYDLAVVDRILNKPLEEFATFKSSSITKNLFLNESLANHPRKSDKTDDEKRFGIPRQNPRRRCLEAIIDMACDGKCRSEDVILESLQTYNTFQVFKKNQIGGVREILILEMDKRILINVLESFMRILCKHDAREMLTEGTQKYKIFNNIQKVQRQKGVKMIAMNYNSDKTKWGPTFMPIQFLYTILPFRKRCSNLFNIFLCTLMNHTNKRCLFPEHLIRAWFKDPLNEHKHEEDSLQLLKEKFLKDKQIYFTNESNMGQGILHYTSSFAHLCMISFRDEIYKIMCQKKEIDPGDWSDLVSSDDSYTCQSIPADGTFNMRLRIILFLRAQEVSELLFNMRTSRQKSSVSQLVSEFNSLFGSNLTSFPTTFKFAISSVLPQNTDSFFRMVKESYNSSRQIMENGGTLELYEISHILNQDYCESMYHTNAGGCNAPEVFGLRREYVPYHLGVYPIGDPTMMLMLGPEFHNYRIYDNLDMLTQIERNLFINSHRIIDVKDPTIFGEMESFDNLYCSVHRIEAHLKPIRRLELIKRKLSFSSEDLYDIISSDILMLFRESKTPEEVYLKVALKLHQTSSSEALRITASSIYFARMSATVSANAFRITGMDQKKTTYAECMYQMLRGGDDVEMTQFFPYMNEYRNLSRLSLIKIEFGRRNPLQTRSVKSLVLSEVHVRIKNKISELFRVHWMGIDTADNSMTRDWINLKTLVPFIKDSYEVTLDQFNGTPQEKVMQLLLLILRLHGYSSKPMKSVMYGVSTHNYIDTYLTIKQQNSYSGFNTKENIDFTSSTRLRNTDELHLLYNYLVLHNHTEGGIPDLRHVIDDEQVRQYCVDPSRNYRSKRKILGLLMTQGLIIDLDAWTNRTQLVLHRWLLRQNYTRDGYSGDFTIIGQLGSLRMMLRQVAGRLHITSTTLNQPEAMYTILEHLLENAGLSLKDLERTTRGHFTCESKMILKMEQPLGFMINQNHLSKFDLEVTYMEIVDDWIILKDSHHDQVMRLPVGLLPTNESEMDLPDIFIRGLSFKKLLSIGCFKSEFQIDYIHRDKIIDILPDINIPKPRVTEITKQRLRLGDGWVIRDEFEQMIEVPSESVYVVDDFKVHTTQQPPPEFKFDLQEYLDLDLADFGAEIMLAHTDPLWMDVQVDSGFLEQLMKETENFKPRVIWNRILSFKEYAITRLCMAFDQLSSSSIRRTRAITNKQVSYALIFVYDRLYTNIEIPSPNQYTLTISQRFLDKFNIVELETDL